MGQYYKAIILGKRNGIKTSFVSYYYNLNGAKLQEHSYIGNAFCNAVENYLLNNPCRLVWAGDYADNEKGKEDNLYYLSKKKATNTKSSQADLSKDLFVINHTKKVYYQRGKIPAFADNWTANPLSILTCEGNGRGNGDYMGKPGSEYVGTWARDEIEVSATRPKDYEEKVYFFKYW